MKDVIEQTLLAIEERENCRILLAVEAGSRAWGFASPDSDYDVRFLYLRPPEAYLKLDPPRDVIELPVNEVLDVNGWDLPKALRLLRRSNPTVFEWFGSSIVYRSSEFVPRAGALLPGCFSPRAALWHYLSMADNNAHGHLQGETVKLKKYFYVLRPLLACRWVLEHRTPPPVPFAQLAGRYLPEALKPAVDALLLQKTQQPELRLIPRVPALDAFLAEGLADVRAQAAALPQPDPPAWEPLDALFLSELRRVWGGR